MFSWKGRRIAITGGTGFIGLHAALEMQAYGAQVVALVRATSDVSRLRAAGIECRVAALVDAVGLARNLADCELVIHAAGAVGFEDDWEAYTRVNVLGTEQLLEAARSAKVERVVHVSSIVAVGASATATPLDENARWTLGKLRVAYVTTKRWAEEVALAANRDGLQVVVVNPSSVLGPNDFTASVFGSLCSRFWEWKVPFYFAGGNNYVDVRDVAAGIRLAAERGRPGQRYLLAGVNRTYQAFFRALCTAAGRSIPHLRLPVSCARLVSHLASGLRRFDPDGPYFPLSQAKLMGHFFFFDDKKARVELGFSTRPFHETLAETYAFWRHDSAPKI